MRGLAVGLALTACSAFAQTDDSAESTKPTPKAERTLQFWVTQLSHDRYLRRQSARRHLVEGGQDSVPILMEELSGGDLESIESVIAVLAKIAETEEPWRTDGATAALESIANKQFGSKAALAKSTLGSFAEFRRQQARVALTQAGVFVDKDNVALGARSGERLIVRIDESFHGDAKVLAWLRWLDDIEFAVVSGPAVTQQVLRSIAKMPSLESLVLVNCELTPQALEPLQHDIRLTALELRYIKLDERLLAEVAKARLRQSLYLMGTGVSADRAERLRVELPGLEIDLRAGGFLGVICRSTFQDYCEVSEVMQDSGAKEAGLEAGDIVVQVDDVKITRFEDLQRQINNHIPGEQIKIRYLRDGKLHDTSATLKKLAEP